MGTNRSKTSTLMEIRRPRPSPCPWRLGNRWHECFRAEQDRFRRACVRAPVPAPPPSPPPGTSCIPSPARRFTRRRGGDRRGAEEPRRCFAAFWFLRVLRANPRPPAGAHGSSRIGTPHPSHFRPSSRSDEMSRSNPLPDDDPGDRVGCFSPREHVLSPHLRIPTLPFGQRPCTPCLISRTRAPCSRHTAPGS